MGSLQSRDQKGQLGRGAVIADVKGPRGSMAFLGRALPLSNAIFDFEMFIDGRFQVIVAGFIHAKR